MIGDSRRSGHVNPVRRIAVAVLVAVAILVAFVIAACSDPSSVRQFSDAADPYPVVLNDETGLVTGIESMPFDTFNDWGEPSIREDPTDPNAFFITWFGGPAHDAALSFKPFQDGYLLRLELHANRGFPGGGTAVGVPRVVRIVTSSPISLDAILVGGSANT